MQRKLVTTIEKKDDDSRLDKWLTERFTYHSRNQWQGAIKRGEIIINGNTCRSSKTLRTGDVVEFKTENYEEPEVDFDYTIIYEDDVMFAVNKPANLPCHPAGVYFNNTLFTHLSEKLDYKIFLINRLDRETSGIVLFAKSKEAAKTLSCLFISKEIQKEYAVVVHGEFPEKLSAYGYLTADDESPVRKKRKFVPLDDKKAKTSDKEIAETKFELIKHYNGLSYVRVLPKTGRLHQIRATLCSLGYPVVGDKIYGIDDSLYLRFIDGELTEKDRQGLIFDRQALHAEKLIFNHPKTKKQITITAPVPKEILSPF